LNNAGLKERSVPEQSTGRDAEEEFRTADLPHAKPEPEYAEAEPEYEMDEMDSLLHEILKSQLAETSEDSVNKDTHFRDEEENNEISEDTVEAHTMEDDYEEELDYKMPEIIETPEVPESFQEEPASDYQPGQPEQDETHVSYEYHSNVQEDTHEPETHEPEGTDYRELTLEDALEHNTEPLPEVTEQHDYVEEPDLENEVLIETRDIDEADASDSVTEHIESVDEREEAKVHVNEQPHETEVPVQAEDYANDNLVAKKKKPKLLNKFDKGIKTELDAAEKLRKKGKAEEALKAFEILVNKYPQSPRARYGKAQSEDDLAEKMRSNEILQRSISTYGEVASLANVPDDLVKLTLKRRADRQQFLGRMKGSLVTLQKLVNLFPNDTSFKNNVGVGYLLIGDNSNAKRVYEEVLSLAPNDGFAKVHYGFILKAENKISESIPYLKEGLESGDPGTDDGRFYFHLGDAMQRVGNKEAYKWYELGHQRGHFASVWQRSLYNVKGLKAQPWWTAKETGYTELVKSLERSWKIIRDEGLAVMDKGKGLFLPEDENLREKGDWSQFTLWQQGMQARIFIAVSLLSLSCHAVLVMRGSNYHFNEGEFVSVETKEEKMKMPVRVFPKHVPYWNDSQKLLDAEEARRQPGPQAQEDMAGPICRLGSLPVLEKVELILKQKLYLSLPSQIKYSVMHPGTHVWPHTGPTNCRLRMHLGLVIPKEGCRIRCAQENRYPFST
ncbi:hypothetical protein lerEdw1_008975, partial [Lerista edwardsae]